MSTIATWGDYEVHFDGLLGRGGMGSVYRAWQRSVGRWVAVKVLDARRPDDPELQQGFLQKFQIEIQALARLNDPRIVTIHQAGEDEGRLWFAMELIEGETVEQRLGERGAFDEEEAARIGIEVARALGAALRQRIIHRDVKPANIFLLKDGSVKLGDFGLARSVELSRTRLTDLQAVACTPEYASPEQAEGGATDHRSDLYSLGCVLYEMVTERPPFSGESHMATLYKHASEPPPSSRLLNPKVTVEFDALIRRCLEKDPADRFQNYSDLIDALLPPTEPMIPAARPPEPAREWVWPAAAAAGVTLLAVLLAAIFTTDPAPPAEARTAAPAPLKSLDPPVLRPPRPRQQAPAPAPEPRPEPAPAVDPEEETRRERARVASETLATFRAALPDDRDAELVGEVPWGTWRPDLFDARGGEARYDPAARAIVLGARRESERVLILRPFAGAKSGYQIGFRFGPGSESPRFTIALSNARRAEIHPLGARLLAGPEGAPKPEASSLFAYPIRGGLVTVLPRGSEVMVFLDDRLLFSAAESGDPFLEGIKLGAGGGTVMLDSVRVMDRTR